MTPASVRSCRTFGVAASMGLMIDCAAAEQSTAAAPDKTGYTLFNPVPAELMRPLSADRPDTTESPYTVDAGHLQIESSIIDWARADHADTLTFAAINLKVGLRHNIDIQFVVDSYVRLDSDEGGVGDAQIRLKMNLWGNDGGPTALALMPFIKLPTASDPIGNEEVEGGLIVPFATDLTEGIGLGLMAEFDAVHDGGSGGYRLEFVHTAVLGFDLSDRLGAFVEYIGVLSSDAYVTSVGVGVTYGLSDNCQLDCGVNIGLNDAADDFNPFVGFTIRF